MIRCMANGYDNGNLEIRYLLARVKPIRALVSRDLRANSGCRRRVPSNYQLHRPGSGRVKRHVFVHSVTVRFPGTWLLMP
jgi:hypothetical protein